MIFIQSKKNEKCSTFIIGIDELNSLYNGNIVPIIKVKSPIKDDIINKKINILISKIVLLKDKYYYPTQKKKSKNDIYIN